MKSSPDYQTIGVIVGRDLVGDALMKLPFLRALRNAYPHAKIHWITSQGPTAYAGILHAATQDLIDEVHETPDWPGMRQTATPGDFAPSKRPPPSFDLLLDTRNRWREARQARKLSAGLFLAPAARYLFSDRRPKHFWNKPPHLADQLLQLVQLAKGSRPPDTGALVVAEALKNKAEFVLPHGTTYVGIAPGAGNPIKIWPRYKFEKLAIQQASKGRVPVFILGPQELDWFEELQATVPGARFPLQDYDLWGTAQLTIDHTLAIAARLDVAVANDSGVGHMLAAMDCPLVSLFGPTAPEKLAPRVTRGLIIKSTDFGSDHMTAIPWEPVDRAIDSLLATAKD